MKNSIILITTIFLGCLIQTSCGINRLSAFKHKFLVYPYELQGKRIDEDNPRKILFGQKYTILMVKKKDGKIFPVEHYKPEHTFVSRVHPRDATWEYPLSISTKIIVDDITTANAIAIKKSHEKNWRIYWLTEESIININKNERLFLPPYQSLEVLKSHNL